MFESKNVFGEELELCSNSPLIGFTRSGCCDSGPEDLGSLTACVQVTKEFLGFSKSTGNDLPTPRPEFGFQGLRSGDRWCLCAARWQKALEADCAPAVVLLATHQAALEIVELGDLKKHAIDLS